MRRRTATPLPTRGGGESATPLFFSSSLAFLAPTPYAPSLSHSLSLSLCSCAQVTEKTGEQERSGRDTVNRLATRLHHLRSTASCAGIYNSPYHVGYHPTAFGVPVEEHLRNAVRPAIKRELAERGKTLKPVGSLPPIEPRNMHQASYGEMMQEERQERWLDKTKRMAQEDFVKSTGRMPLNYPGSVHVATGYHPPPASLERGVDKTRWVSDQNFKPAVPSNRLVDPAGMNEKSRMAMSGSYIPAA